MTRLFHILDHFLIHIPINHLSASKNIFTVLKSQVLYISRMYGLYCHPSRSKFYPTDNFVLSFTIKIQFTYHLLKLYNSIVFSVFIELYSHHCNLIWDHFPHSKRRNLVAISSNSPSALPLTPNGSFLVIYHSITFFKIPQRYCVPNPWNRIIASVTKISLCFKLGNILFNHRKVRYVIIVSYFFKRDF